MSTGNFSINAISCEFEGDPDTYGLGIRLGLYLQWVSTVLAFFSLPDEVQNMVNVNRCFTLSTFIALLYTSFSEKLVETNALGPLILVHLCCFGIVFTQCGFLHPSSRYSLHGALINLSLAYAIAIYGIWFLFVGYNKMLPPCTLRRDVYGKMQRALAESAFRYTLAIFLVLCICIHLLKCIYFTVIAIRKHDRARFVDNLFEVLKPWRLFRFCKCLNVWNNWTFRIALCTSTLTALFAMLVFIPFIEAIIYANHVQGVTSLLATGQLIPLVVGSSGLLVVSFKILRNHSRRRRARSISSSEVEVHVIPPFPGNPSHKTCPRQNGHVRTNPGAGRDSEHLSGASTTGKLTIRLHV